VIADRIRVSPAWLALREPADAAARAVGLVDRLPAAGRHVIHDLGSGTASMARWLAPLLEGSQHWVLHDTDDALLELATVPGVTLETRLSDVSRLQPDDLAGATLITASALLDLLTGDELDRLVAVCGAAGCPVLLTLSVVGRVELEPADRLDRHVEAAFNAHQRRLTGRGRLLGPDAVTAAASAFGRSGAEVVVRSSPWRLGPSEAPLAAEWLDGWVGAAREQEPGLDLCRYAGARLEQAAAGALVATVQHADLLVLP
jgi:hypothetical protein